MSWPAPSRAASTARPHCPFPARCRPGKIASVRKLPRAASELGRATGQKFPVRALLLPVHQDVQIGGALLAIGNVLAFAHPVESHDRSGTDDTNLGVLVGQ